MAVSLSGQDTLIINNHVFADLGDQNCVELTFPNDIANMKTGKNGNSIYAFNESGRQCEMVVRAIRASDDDRFLNNLMAQQLFNFAGTILMIGQFSKVVGNGLGIISHDTYLLSGGVFTKQVEAKSNTDGETDQSLSIYYMKFSIAPRTIG